MTEEGEECECGSRRCVARCKYDYEVAYMIGCSPSSLCKWKSKALMTLDDYRASRKSRKKKRYYNCRIPFYEDLEDEVYIEFAHRRRFCGFPTDGYWIR